MPSPFSGMNPYLELPALWHEFHNRLIVAISDALTPYLQPKYYVAKMSSCPSISTAIASCRPFIEMFF
jgi:hypothetical protein